MTVTKPGYYDTFRCIAGACPDSCCKEWDVQVDAAAAAFYRGLPGPLGDRLRQVLREEDGETFMTVVDGRCSMWREDGLCRIQAELGEGALCGVCRNFPRLRHDYGDFRELGLELSCPEAARLILSGERCDPVTEECPGDQLPEYDAEAMAILKASRQEARAILAAGEDPAETLARLLLYGYHVQGELDGGESEPFDAGDVQSLMERCAGKGDREGLLRFFSGLEILTEAWRQRLSAPAPRAMGRTELALARYLVDRYWLQAVSDYDLVGRVKLTVIACLLTALLGGDPMVTAQLFSKEIENDADNVDAILDGAYGCEALTDDKLLGLLGGLPASVE